MSEITQHQILLSPFILSPPLDNKDNQAPFIQMPNKGFKQYSPRVNFCY